MERKNLEQYLGQYIEIMLMPDGRKTAGVLLKCEDDHIALGNELWVYPMIWGVRPVDNPPEISQAQAAAPAPVQLENNSPVTVAPVPVLDKPKSSEIIFKPELEKYFDELQESSEALTLNADYVRKFRSKGPNKIQGIIESILTKYQYAVKAHEDRPYSMRMREILNSAYNLWKYHKDNIAAAEIYAFVLYLTGESEKSLKIYMRIQDFHGAFMAASSAASKILAAACIAVSEKLTPKNFAALLKLEPPQLTAVLNWILENISESDDEIYKELCFKYSAALAYKSLGFKAWEDKENLFTPENLEALKNFLADRPQDKKIISDALKLADKNNLPVQEINKPQLDWASQKFEGEFDFFNPNRDKLYGFIKCPELKKYDIPLRSESSVFVHFYQIQDRELRRKLLTEKKMHPQIKVTFKLGNNLEGAAAYEVKEKNYDLDSVLKINVLSALSEEGEIEFFRRHEEIPFGKVRAKDGKLFTFNEKNIIDPLLAVFLEYTPNAEGQPVRFSRVVLDDDKVQIHNIESAVPFPEEKIKAWEAGGLIQKAKARMNLESESTENAPKISDVLPEEFQAPEFLDPELEELIDRSYTPLDPYSPEKINKPLQPRKPFAQKKNGVEIFNELPKFLQDKILSVTIAGKCNTEFLGDTFYRRGHYAEVRATYLQLVSKFNSEDSSLTNAERAERYFLIARYVYNFFSLADEEDIKSYSPDDEDNIRIMAYKGLEYLIYDRLDGAKRNEENYDIARRYCLLKIANEIQETRHIDGENTWLKIYIASYFVNGLRQHSSGKWSAQNISLKGSSLLECNTFDKFFEGLLPLAYLTEPELLIPRLKSLLYNPEYAAVLLKKLGVDYSNGASPDEIIPRFQAAVDDYTKSKDIFALDPEVKLSPEIFKILSVQSALIRLMKKELSYILRTPIENLDAALKRAVPILDTDEYRKSLEKTRRKYDPDASLLDILPLNVLGKIMGQYWPTFAVHFNNKPYISYWRERFDKLQWVRNPVFHAHPEYVKKEDIEEVKAICLELSRCLK